MQPLREADIFDVLRAVESGAVAAERGAVVHADEGEEDVEFLLSTGWRFVVALEGGKWGGIVLVEAPDGRRLELGVPPFIHDAMPALCEYAPDSDALVRWLTGQAPEPRRT